MALVQYFDYVRAIYALLPRGDIWPLEPDDSPVFDALIEALAQEFSRVTDNGRAFLEDFLPDTSTSLLPQWERLLGLSGLSLTDAQRRAQVISQLRRNADPTLINIQAAADTWGNGAVITGTGQGQFLMGIGEMGDALGGDAWLFTVVITYNGPPDDAFQAAMRAAIPRHLTVLFQVM